MIDEVLFEAFHVRNIGHSDIESIGRTYLSLRQTRRMTEKSKRTVWERVKEALQEAGYESTQTAAARLIGVKQGSISEWNEPGRYGRLEHLTKVASRTNVCVEWLIHETGPKHPGPPEELAAEQLWAIWGRLSDLTKGKLLGIAQSSLGEPERPSKAARPRFLQRRTGRGATTGTDGAT